MLICWKAHIRRQSAGDVERLMAAYLFLAAVFGAPLIFWNRLFWLIPFGLLGGILLLVSSRQAALREDRTIFGEILAIAGLTMTAPMAHYVTQGKLENTAGWLWAMNSLYFMSSVFYLKLRVLNVHAKHPETQCRLWKTCAVFHVFLLAALMMLAFKANLSNFVLIAFAPVFLRSFWSLLVRQRHLNLCRAGVFEVVYALIFLIFLTLTFRQT